ncbi:hypothetical protein CDAR_166761 [Caerostris darwini]|uniref:Uncharacterized protein n=1 Tax=Caerostris darwini TaxID=1538125 RepID=A0AAV4R7E8_9ARAC|nr:hypothetical protein CDAR_166761 [Caerostris darwini]
MSGTFDLNHSLLEQQKCSIFNVNQSASQRGTRRLLHRTYIMSTFISIVPNDRLKQSIQSTATFSVDTFFSCDDTRKNSHQKDIPQDLLYADSALLQEVQSSLYDGRSHSPLYGNPPPQSKRLFRPRLIPSPDEPLN